MPGLKQDSRAIHSSSGRGRAGAQIDDTAPDRDNGRSRAWVTEGLIEAIKALEANQNRTPPQAELAESAFSKLQFDFPVVQPEELSALAAELRCSLSSKTGGRPFPLTSKLVDNITDGASFTPQPHNTTNATSSSANTTNGPTSSPSSTINAPPSSSSTTNGPPPSSNTISGAPSSSSSNLTNAPPSSSNPTSPPTHALSPLPPNPSERPLPVTASIQLLPPGQPSAVRGAYQQLCAVVLLEWVAKLLSLPEEAAWNMLGSFHADELVHEGSADVTPPSEETQNTTAPRVPAESGLEQSGAASSHGGATNGGTTGQDGSFTPGDGADSIGNDGARADSIGNDGARADSIGNDGANLDSNLDRNPSNGVEGQSGMKFGSSLLRLSVDADVSMSTGSASSRVDGSITGTTTVAGVKIGGYDEVEAEELDDDDTPYEDMAEEAGMGPASQGATSFSAQSNSWSTQSNLNYSQSSSWSTQSNLHYSQSTESQRISPTLNGTHTSWANRTAGPLPSHPNGHTNCFRWSHSGTPAPTSHSAPSRQYSWPALKTKLLTLCSHTRYSVLCDSGLWSRDSHLAESVMAVLRTLGAHTRSAELQEVVCAYVQLLLERLLDVPADMHLLTALGAALGLAGGGGALGEGSPSRRDPPSPTILSPECSLLLNTLSQLAARVQSPSHLSLLWDQVNTHFLACVDSGLVRVERAGESHPDVHASLSLLCSVLEFHVSRAPPGQRAAGLNLVGRGTLRVLSVLFTRHAAQRPAEALRRAVLLCAASSASSQQWLLGVPGIHRALQGAFFGREGAGEAHGIVWGLVLKKGAQEEAAVKVLEALENPQEASRALHFLQILSSCQAAAPHGQRLWGPSLHSHMQRIFNKLQKQLSTLEPTASGPAIAESAGPESAELESAGPESTGLESAGPESTELESAGLESARPESAGLESARPESATSATMYQDVFDHDKSPRGRGGVVGDWTSDWDEEARVKVQKQVLPAAWKLLKELLLQVDAGKKD